jgi:LmbE family N-acetylglucosaminyl deacetylase
LKSLLFVAAHPDDETFVAGGTIAKCVSEGGTVTLACATRGERGKTAGLVSEDKLPQVREQELREAMAILGVGAIHFLGYTDKQLGEAPVDEMRHKLVALIRQTRPEVVITFDPHGYNLHPDHMAISRFTSDALAAAADRRWFRELGAPHQVSRLLWTRPVPPFLLHDLPEIAEIPAMPGADFMIDIEPWAEKKKAALRAYRTQKLSLEPIFFAKPEAARHFRTEVFRLAMGSRPATVPAHDLFVL